MLLDLTDRKIKGRVNVISPTVSTVKRARAKVKKSIKDKKTLPYNIKAVVKERTVESNLVVKERKGRFIVIHN